MGCIGMNITQNLRKQSKGHNSERKYGKYQKLYTKRHVDLINLSIKFYEDIYITVTELWRVQDFFTMLKSRI